MPLDIVICGGIQLNMLVTQSITVHKIFVQSVVHIHVQTALLHEQQRQVKTIKTPTVFECFFNHFLSSLRLLSVTFSLAQQKVVRPLSNKGLINRIILKKFQDFDN